MKVGSLVYATEQGLGILAKSFYDAGVLSEVLVVRHQHRPNLGDTWYPKSEQINIKPFNSRMAQLFCSRMDVMLFFETPFDWELITFCRSRGVKTVLMPMYECMPKMLPAYPDMFICPSLLDLQYYDKKQPTLYGSRFIQVPVDSSIKWRQRTEAKVFVHNAGHGGLLGRNGYLELMESLRYVKSDAKFIIRRQFAEKESYAQKLLGPDRVKIVDGTIPYEDLWIAGDVFIFPEKFNGLSLPLQEARAAGMLVMATDRFPMNTWLPTKVKTGCSTQGTVDTKDDELNPLISAKGSIQAQISGRCNTFDESVIDPKDIAAKIDEWYGRDISEYSLQGKQWAETMSWEVLKPQYDQALADLIKG